MSGASESPIINCTSVKEYLDRVGAEMRSVRVAVVKEQGAFGYWQDLCTITFKEDGTIKLNPENKIAYRPTDDEASAIKAEIVKISWPKPVNIPSLHDENLPKMWKEAPEKNRFVFRDTRGEIVMLQVRIDDQDKGNKKYVPITLWDDGKYRFQEMGEQIPLFGLETLKDYSTVLIVEGAKTAKYIWWLANSEEPEAIEERKKHPWGDELRYMAVVGWCSGALSPSRTDWSPINRAGFTKAYVALDNDKVGREALPEIAKKLRCVTEAISFTDEWPISADLYDPFPDVFFEEINGMKYYVGPSMRDCIIPATWMTDREVFFDDKGKEKVKVTLRNHARNLWQYMDEVDAFCYLEDTNLIYNPDILDKKLRPFSDSKKTSDLILENFTGAANAFDYCPNTKKRRITVKGRPVINMYTPSNIKPQEGDVKPFMDFMEQLIPNPDERHNMLRWIATLYAKPEVRMTWAPLLISAQTGTGKSTLGTICAYLVGNHNTSFPNERAVASEFNSWIFRKRLIVVNEIYQGESWKMFNRLKELITEPVITLRRMRTDPIDVSNWSHFILLSNSFAALKIDQQDRRIFIPGVTEDMWGAENWSNFRRWLESGGYAIIAQWALDFGHYVVAGERAPMSLVKQEIIEASASRTTTRLEELARSLVASSEPKVISVEQATSWVEAVTGKTLYETPLQVRKLFSNFGAIDLSKHGVKRSSFKSTLTYFVGNEAALAEINEAKDENAKAAEARKYCVDPNDLVKKEEIV